MNMHTDIGFLLISMAILFVISFIIFWFIFGKDAKLAMKLPPIQGHIDNGDADIDDVTECDLKLTNIWSVLDDAGKNH